MNVTTNVTYSVHNTTDSSTNEKKQVSAEKNSIEDSSIVPNTLKNMSFEEIQTYLLQNNIDDELDSRANDLLKLQKFANKVDTATYTKMTNALLEEETVSLASMRYATFPSEEILDENPQLFNALLETSLGIEDTIRSLIFSLDLKKDFKDLGPEQKYSNNDLDFSNQSFIEILMEKLFSLEENNKNKDSLSESEKNRIADYTSLVDNLNKYLIQEKENISVDILI